MINVTISVNGNKENDIVKSTATLREVLEANDVNYRGFSVMVEGEVTRDLDRPVGEMTDNEKLYVCIASKQDNAASATIMGSALVVTSSLKLEDIKLIEKYRPEALTLYQEKDGKLVKIFKIMTDEEGAGSLSENGACFGPTASPEGNARLTMFCGALEGDAEAAFIDQFGAAILRLNDLEAALVDQTEAIRAEHELIKSSIVIA